MDAFDFRNEQVNRIMDIASVAGEDTLFRELLVRMSNSELEDFAVDMETFYGEDAS